MKKAFVRSMRDLTPGSPPLHSGTTSWAMVTRADGSETVELFIDEISPDGAAHKDVHEHEDHVFFIISGYGYAIVDAERYDYGPGDALWIAHGAEHEMYVTGKETLRMVTVVAPPKK